MAPSAEVLLLQPNRSFSTTDPLLSKSLPSTPVHKMKAVPSSGRQTLILHPAFITTDFDALRFEAAAHNQLPFKDSSSDPSTPASNISSTPDSDSTPSFSPIYSTLLVSSPYNSVGHHLDLTRIPPASRLFALALTALQPLSPSYATAPYTSSLNFPHVLSVLRSLIARESFAWHSTSFYVVVFRSQLRAGVDQEWLAKLDVESHREACESGGLLKYWFGKADLRGERRNLATCFWSKREDARLGGLGPWHARARRAGGVLYESIVFTTLRFTVLDGAEGYRVEDWVD